MLKMDVEIKLDLKKLEDNAKKIGKKEAKTRIDLILTQAENDCPVKTEKLKKSKYKKTIEDGYEGGFSAPYAEKVDKTPQALLDNGKTHFFSNAVKKYSKGVGPNA